MKNNNQAWAQFVSLMTSTEHSNIGKFNTYGSLVEKVEFEKGSIVTIIVKGVTQEQILNDLSAYEFIITTNKMFSDSHMLYMPLDENTDTIVKLQEQFKYIDCGSLDETEFYFISSEHQPVLSNRTVYHNVGNVLSSEYDIRGIYDEVIVLKQNEYISDIAHKIDFSTGKILVVADVGTGKSVFFSSQNNVKFIAPLTAIKESIIEGNDSVLSGASNVSTWNAIDSLGDMNEQDKAEITLVVDECHGLVMDGYKQNVINRVYSQLDEFKSVVFMSGTVEPSYFSNVQFDRVYRIIKPSIAKKTVLTTYTKNIKASIVEYLRVSTDKAIVLLDNKAALKAIAGQLEQAHKKCLIITSDNKTEKHIQAFFKSGMMSEYDVILGTSCIVEGLSIEDNFECADVIIGGHITPERMEQFTNRFRKVSKEKNVHYFINYSEREDVPEFKVDDVVADCIIQTEYLNKIYSSFTTEVKKIDLVKRYRRDASTDSVYFHDGEFHVSYTGIDLLAAANREQWYRSSFTLFEEKLKDYGFDVKMPKSVEGNSELESDIKSEVDAVNKSESDKRTETLNDVINDLKEGVFNDSHEDELYGVTIESINKLSKKGLDDNDIEKLVELYKEDEEIFRKAHTDAEERTAVDSFPKFIKSNLVVDSNNMATSDEVKRVAELVVSKVLTEYFNGDVALMVKSRSWKPDVELGSNGGVVIKTNRASRVLRRYITVGNSTKIRINRERVRAMKIESFSLTGLRFSEKSGTVISNLKHIKKEAEQGLNVLGFIKSLRSL
ncbi:hypothetical protein NUK47_02115 [Aeromonas hydrophila]|uniref:hypothetical protein n=1 Tax=Aeromonas hydrophila TaxID=644 RepID=UPI00214DE43B|nr:hypothetical protein [Aeromonas hydrophila]MCR3907563.1 hypothetical protein [Aeromonas hydrophila]